MGSTFNVKYDLVLALRSQILECLRECFYTHALGEPWTPARSEKNKRDFFCWFFKPFGNASLLIDLFTRPLVDRDIFWPLYCAHSRASQLQNWSDVNPIPLLMAVSVIPNMWHSSTCCKRHSRPEKKKNVCLSAFEPARTFVHEGKYPLLGRTDHDVEHARSWPDVLRRCAGSVQYRPDAGQMSSRWCRIIPFPPGNRSWIIHTAPEQESTYTLKCLDEEWSYLPWNI